LSAYFTGYISNVRILKGAAQYTATFTPPTGALQAVNGTSLLTCAYSTFRDGSSNNFAITAAGNAVVNTLNPFPTSQLPNPALGGAGNGVYTMSQYAALKAANLWPAFDPFYKNVTLNLHGNAGSVLPFNTDASTNNFQVTQVGDTRPSNYTPFITNGYWSNAFDGSGDFLNLSDNAAFQFGSGDFTYECWVYPTKAYGASVSQGLISYGVPGAFNNTYTVNLQLNPTTGYAELNVGYTVIVTGTSQVPLNQWSHIVGCRTSGVTSIFVNGTREATSSTAVTLTTSAGAILRLGGQWFADAADRQLGGYLSNARVIKGAGPYNASSSTITVPTTPLTAISGTSLLTCQSNRFIDNSTNAFTITPNGNVAVNPLQPFTAPTGTSAYGSGFFDGSGDYLTVAQNSAFNFGTGAFTVEAFVYLTAYPSGGKTVIFSLGNGADVSPATYTGWALTFTNTQITFYRYDGTETEYVASAVIPLNAWSHVVAVRNGSSSLSIYLNGTRVLNTTSSLSYNNVNSNNLNMSYWTSGGGTARYITGYVSNGRIVNGTAVYDPTVSTLTVPTSPLTAITNTSLLTVQTNAPSQNNTFLDSSTNNFVITRNGNTTQGTFTPYGANWSNYFDGSGDYLTIGSSGGTAIGTSDFTLEFWLYPTNSSVTQIDYRPTNTNGAYITIGILPGSSGSIDYYVNGSTRISSSTAPAVNVWSHIAVSRVSGSTRFFINGVQVGSTYADSTTYAASNGNIWWNAFLGARPCTGYVSNYRLVLSGLYSSTFTPPTSPLTAISGTQTLTCQSNRFIDISSNAYTITRNGDVSVQRFSPFSPTSAYSTSVIGGSAYFDGSGDSMTVGAAANCASGGAFAMGANFTVEFWFYPLSTSEQTLIENFTGTGGPGWTIYRKSGGQIEIYNGTSAFSGSVVLTTGQWYHIAFVRTSSTSAKTYINGVADMSTTSFGSGEYYQSTYPLYVGQRNPGDGRNFYTTGYFSDVRVTKSAVYSANFTPPTAPISPIANTSAMLNYTNAAIFDNSMMTDWETLGSAQLNTAYKKYGSGSISMLATGDYCRSTQPSTFGDINGGDFTIEFWVYFTSVAAGRALISKYGNTAENAGGLGYVLQFQQSVPSLRFVLGVGGGTDAVYDFAWSPVVSTWYHVAVTRSGSSARAFINGSQIGSTTTVSTSDVASPNATQIGKTHTVAQYLLGYMDDVRVTKGVARYTANFTPPTSQVQDQ
jgi:hypothetical protein